MMSKEAVVEGTPKSNHGAPECQTKFWDLPEKARGSAHDDSIAWSKTNGLYSTIATQGGRQE